ncbi:16467_t:CDS:2 [Funneliformis geosporum]|uniref:16467_t:CDS:1 n=1 Tax=Funneliformis geosporum TaxID=1117311 RepID=A0A9W4X475_9GLOM|nr:16467_t:CDS:2 [Funneliformis geosporum]
MADIQSQAKITENSVVNSKAETPMVVNQKLLSALNYLRDELEKAQKENKDEESAFSEVGDDGDNDHEKKKLIEELRAQVDQFEKENKETIANGQQERDKLQLQLDQTREEKNQLEVQHQSLIAKLANFKTSIADKLKADNEELNRKKQQINELNEHNKELNNTILKLQGDLSTSLDENERSSQQLESLQSHIFEMQQQSSHEISEKDDIIRDLQHNLDRTEREREEWEVNAMELKSAKDELLIRIKHLEREMDALRLEKENLRAEKNSESESLANLQNVLEEFEAAKQSEIREAVEGIQRRLATATKELAEFKERALLAENQLAQIKEEIGKTSQYEKEIKEKNLLIGKLRHEALRRMREESSENNVDKRLITNLLIAFFNTPRGDSKRYEILQLMANMLHWTEEQKEQVGLIRRALTNRSVEDRSNGWVSGLWTPTIERTRSRLSEEVPRPTIRISEDEGPKEKDINKPFFMVCEDNGLENNDDWEESLIS